MVLKNEKGHIIRVFHVDSDKVYVVYRSNKGRIDFCSSLNFFDKDSIVLIDEIEFDKIKKYKIPYMSASLEVCDSELKETDIHKSIPLPVFNNKGLQAALVMVFGFYIMAGGALYVGSQFQSLPQAPAPQRLVKVIKTPTVIQQKKIVLGSKNNFLSSVEPSQPSKRVKKSLKKMGALSVLGSLSKGKSKGGINLGNKKVSAGPGFRSVSGSSGGVQSQLYSKGMIASALGTGGNIRGGGGHGTKGSQEGGGSDGYGKLNLIGSEGTEDLYSSETLNPTAGAFDFSIIDREIVKNREKIRQCYLKALQKKSDLKGLFEFVFQVNENGRVVFSNLAPSSEVQFPEVSSCIFRVIRSVHFPIRVQETTQINYAFDLSDLKGGS